MRSTLAIATVAFLALGGLAACGDDSEEEAATIEEFCERAQELQGNEGVGPGNETSQENLDGLDELIPIAPEEIGDDLQVVRDTLADAAQLEADLEGADQAERTAAIADHAADNPEFSSAFERIQAFVDEQCALDSDDAPGDDGAESTDSAEEEQPTTGSDPVPDAAIPDDITLTRQDATLITWGEIEDAFDYEVRVDGELLGTSFETSYTALGAVDGEITVEALDSEPAPDVQTEPVEVLAIEWTEEPDANYYVQYTDIDGALATTASSPFILDGPPEEIEAVRFGPAMLVRDDETTSYEPPFDFGDQYYVELPLP